MSYEYFYGGTPYTLEPEYGELFTGYRIPAGQIGIPTSIQTANQIQEVSNTLNQGAKIIELQPLSPEVFEAIPKQHFKEVNRLTQLTGASTTLHAPMIDPAGFTKSGWSESERMEAERQFEDVVEKVHELSPKGNIPMTIHASGIGGTEYSKPTKELIDTYKRQVMAEANRLPTADELKKLEESRIVVIDQESGQLTALKREEKYYPEKAGVTIRIPEQEIDTVNNTDWVNGITNLAFYKKEADEIIGHAQANLQPLLDKIQNKEQLTEKEFQNYAPSIENLKRADLFLNNIAASFRNIYHKASKYGDETSKKKLAEIQKEWEINSEERGKINPVEYIIKKSNLIDNTLSKLNEIKNPPQVYKKIEDFAVDKTADTLSNTAFYGYKKYKDNAPIVSIENLFPGMAFSRSEELKKLVETTKEQFIAKAKKEGVSSSEAKRAADRLIGVTWDVGHLNMLRKSGYTEEELIKESANIAPLVKHVHITDNFGFSDAHLPPGMGNVPMKGILQELEKSGFKGAKIIEAGGFVQHFKTSPQPYVLEAFGSPLYAMSMAPYWNQIRATQGNYFATPSAYFPEQHFSIYGGGFSGLPAELGGQASGKKSRFAGSPSE